jgi:YHYH protein
MVHAMSHPHDHDHATDYPTANHHDDGHHGHGSLDDVEIGRRKVLYFLSAGLVGATVFGPSAAAKVKKQTTAARRKRTATPSSGPVTPTSTTLTSTSVGVPTPVVGGASTIDPWSLYPKSVKARRTSTELIVESTGMPEHLMMIGITNWQQQFPLPQPYSVSNAWRLPAKGVLSETPISAKTALFRGAIALAINGVPIFNALNNRGEDSFLIGELDQWGGHCGRADDYHYHAAPLHLTKGQSPAVPIAIAMDGFAIYGLTEPDGSPIRALDEFNGHADVIDEYHYHASVTYPYINGGLRGKVSVADGQIDPQPAATPIRPAGNPLRGASITSFSQTAPAAWRLQYKLSGNTFQVDYTISGNAYTFVFTDPSGSARTESFQSRQATK